jgi:dihydroorotate dehydrogenase (fumarate)
MDLSTTYMGMSLKNPLVPSAAPVSESVDKIRQMEDAGAAAVVMFSIFEEQVRQEDQLLDDRLHAGTESFAESLSYFPSVGDYHVGPEEYLQTIRKATDATDIPIIGSLNGVSHEGWISYARKIQEAGAKGLELNAYYIPTNPALTGADVEQQYLDVLKAVKSAVTIPVALKIGPFFSSMANMAQQFDQAGADALVLFNRFYQPDFDLENMTVASTLNLSTPEDIRLPLCWIAILHGRLQASLAATTGVHTVREVAKYLLAGADVVMTTAALLKKGIQHLTTLVEDLDNWLEENEYESVRQMKGVLSQKSVADPAAFERANYIKILEKYKTEYRMG